MAQGLIKVAFMRAVRLEFPVPSEEIKVASMLADHWAYLAGLIKDHMVEAYTLEAHWAFPVPTVEFMAGVHWVFLVLIIITQLSVQAEIISRGRDKGMVMEMVRATGKVKEMGKDNMVMGMVKVKAVAGPMEVDRTEKGPMGEVQTQADRSAAGLIFLLPIGAANTSLTTPGSMFINLVQTGPVAIHTVMLKARKVFSFQCLTMYSHIMMTNLENLISQNQMLAFEIFINENDSITNDDNFPQVGLGEMAGKEDSEQGVNKSVCSVEDDNYMKSILQAATDQMNPTDPMEATDRVVDTVRVDPKGRKDHKDPTVNNSTKFSKYLILLISKYSLRWLRTIGRLRTTRRLWSG